MNPPRTTCAPYSALPWPVRAVALGLCAAALALSRVLWPSWLHDENLSHGMFLPLLSAILLCESRRDPSPRFLSGGAVPTAAAALLVLSSLAGLVTAALYAVALGAGNALAEGMLSLSWVCMLAAAWIGFADRRVGFLPFNWTAAVGVLLWLFASPPPPGTYARVALSLQGQISSGVVRLLHAAGIAAEQQGTVIELARTTVGVSEACSGARSLLSCTAAGLFLSALVVRRPASRALVVFLSPVIGLAMNFVRSLLLTLLANGGVAIEGRWHDLTGASILVVTTLLLLALALGLRRLERADPAPGKPLQGRPGFAPALGLVGASLIATAAASLLLALKPVARAPQPSAAPDLEALLPETPAGWISTTTPDLEQFSPTLRTHSLVERIYSSGTSPESTHITLYLAYWSPGQAPVSLVDSHTPDACWPGTGWEARPLPHDRAALAVANRQLATAECRLFVHGTYANRVWFWHLYGGKPLDFVDPYSATRLLRIAWRYGLGEAKDQLFVRVSSNRPWEEIAGEPSLRQFFKNLEPLGM